MQSPPLLLHCPSLLAVLQLLIAAQSTPPGASELLPGPGGGATAGAPGGGRAVNTGAAVGGAVGGFVGLLAVTSAVYLFVARRRRRNGANLPAAKNGSSTLPDSAALGAGPGSMGDSGKPGQGPAAARCSPLLKLLRMARPAGGGGGGAGSAAGAAAWDQLPQSPARSLAAARGGGQAAGGGNGKGPHEPTASILLAPEPGPRDVKTPAALPVPLSPQPQGRQQQQQQQQEEEQQEQVPARRGVGAPAVLNTAGLEAGAEADAAGAGGWPGRGVGAGSAGAWRWHTDTAGTDDQEQELELELQQEDASAFSASFAAQGRSNSQTAGAGVPGGLAGGSVRPGSVGPPGGGGGGGSAMVTMMDHMLGSVASRQGQAQGQAGGRAPVVPGSRLGAAGSLSPLLNTQQQLRLPPSRQPSGGPGTGGTGTGMVTTALVLTGGGSTGGMSTSGEVTRNMLAAEIDTMIRRIQVGGRGGGVRTQQAASGPGRHGGPEGQVHFEGLGRLLQLLTFMLALPGQGHLGNWVGVCGGTTPGGHVDHGWSVEAVLRRRPLAAVPSRHCPTDARQHCLAPTSARAACPRAGDHREQHGLAGLTGAGAACAGARGLRSRVQG